MYNKIKIVKVMKEYIKPQMEIVDICSEEILNISFGGEKPTVDAEGKVRNDFFDFDDKADGLF